MRILWFTNTSSLYEGNPHQYNGGGWIESLELLLSKQSKLELAVSFYHKKDSHSCKKGNTVYYPILIKKPNPIRYILNNWKGKIESQSEILYLLDIVNDFKPNVIHVFGTEGVFSSIQEFTEIPVVIHLQGLINPYYNAFFPPGFSDLLFLFNKRYLFDNLLGRGPYFQHKRFKNQADREVENLKSAKYLMGRTQWDHSVSKLYNKNVIYFHVDEVLRPDFYLQNLNVKNFEKKITIVSTISSTVYKGIDFILKSAKLLKEQTNIEFHWKLIGINGENKLLKHFEEKLQIKHNNYNIECLGVKKTQDLVKLLNQSDLFIHPSYIDNSPNSICEAQILGLPIIACNVGGVGSLIKHEVDGILIPANGIYELLSYILDYSENRLKYKEIGINAVKVAKERHNKEKIIEKILFSYCEILKG